MQRSLATRHPVMESSRYFEVRLQALPHAVISAEDPNHLNAPITSRSMISLAQRSLGLIGPASPAEVRGTLRAWASYDVFNQSPIVNSRRPTGGPVSSWTLVLTPPRIDPRFWVPASWTNRRVPEG